MSVTVAELIKRLGKHPPDAAVYAYEGEVTAIVVVTGNSDRDELEVIVAEYPRLDPHETV